MQQPIAGAGPGALAFDLIDQEARALLTRLERVKPFVLYETMVLAAAPSLAAQVAIETFMAQGRNQLRRLALDFLGWLRSPEARAAPPAEAQRRFALVRLSFNDMLSQFDVFADVITQRSERDNGVWLSGLDVVAADALALPGAHYNAPPVVCYLKRGHGAAIRRARTRLPGGGESPIAIIQIPRERMVGSGIASSLVHEVGHQGAALLGLIGSLRPVLDTYQHNGRRDAVLWRFWARWISEILADLWSVGRVGVAGTMGLMGVVTLPPPFVYRVSLDDPHPIPWIRVKLSAAMGDALYPDPQWGALSNTWDELYPREQAMPNAARLLALLEESIPEFVEVLVAHRPPSLHGRPLREALATPDREPSSLRALHDSWGGSRLRMQAAPPTLVMAVIGQAKADGRIRPDHESSVLADLLTDWAMQGSLDASTICAGRLPGRQVGPTRGAGPAGPRALPQPAAPYLQAA